MPPTRGGCRCTAAAVAWEFDSTVDRAIPGRRSPPHYDTLLVKVTGSGRDFPSTVAKLHRALSEFRLRGVKSNLQFLMNVLRHPRFVRGEIDTHFVDQTPELFDFAPRRNRAQKLLRYLGDRIVNVPSVARCLPRRRDRSESAATSRRSATGGLARHLGEVGTCGVCQGGSRAPAPTRHRYHLERRPPVPHCHSSSYSRFDDGCARHRP